MIRAEARAFAARDPRTHWSVLAALLAAVTDRQLYETYGFRSTRAWAEAELELSPVDTVELIRLYRLIQQSGRLLEAWAGVSKGKARVIGRALHLGGNPEQWLTLALEAKTEDELRAHLTRQLGDDVFLPYTVHIPESLEPLVREAMRKALPIATDEEVPEDLAAQDVMVARKDMAFRCLEVVCGSFLT